MNAQYEMTSGYVGSMGMSWKIVDDTTANTAQAATVTAGTAPTCKTIGVVTGPAVANVTPCDVDIPEVQ